MFVVENFFEFDAERIYDFQKIFRRKIVSALDSAMLIGVLKIIIIYFIF